jgi:hypothetical protein
VAITIGDAILYLHAKRDTLTSDLNAAEGQIKGWSTRVQETLSKVSTKLTIGVTLPLVVAGKKAVQLASDYEESLNKVNVVFGESSDVITEFSEDAATALGMSRGQALEAAGSFGNLFTAMGLSGEKSAEMSTSLIQLAADLASFNNIDPTVALQKLQSGLVGETEPLRALGVNINEAAVKAKALEMGLWDGKGALDAAAAAQARYALILEQTGKAQGDFERTSGSLANQLKSLNAQWGDALTTLGQNLLPILKDTVIGLNSLLTAFNALPEGTKKVIVGFGVFAALAGPLGNVINLLMKIGPLIGLIKGAFMLLGGVLAGITAPVWLLIAAIVAFIATLIIFGPKAAQTVSMLWQLMIAVLRRMASDIVKWGTFIGTSLVNGIWNGLKTGWTWLTTNVQTLVKNLLAAAKAALGISSPSSAFAMQIGRPSAMGIGAGFQAAIPALAAQMQLALSPLPAMVGGRSVKVGHIEFHGSFSRSELARLDRRSEKIAGNVVEDVLGGE